MHWYGDPGWSWWWIAMPLMMLVVWGSIIALVAWVVRGWREPAHGPRDGSAGPLGLLEERFARGEIDREEFESRRAVLSGGHRR